VHFAEAPTSGTCGLLERVKRIPTITAAIAVRRARTVSRVRWLALTPLLDIQYLPHYQREQFEQALDGSGPAGIETKRAAGADPTHGKTAAARRAEANITRKRQAREWDEEHGKLVDLSAFRRDILPLIQSVPLSQLRRATGLSIRYVSLIRRGERTPHPRHWQAFLSTAEIAASAPTSRR
jgi:hypothetical protein